MDYMISPLTPSEAAVASGVSMAQQLNLRKGKHLPVNSGHARFDVKGLALLSVYGAFSSRGFGPKVSSQSAEYVADAVYQHLLYQPEVYSRKLIREFEMEVDAECDDLFVLHYGEEATPEMRGGFLTAIARQELAGEIDPRLVVEFLPPRVSAPSPRFIVSWPDGTFSAGDWEDLAIDFQYSHAGKIDGPFFVASAEDMAKRIAERLPRPMIFHPEEKV